MIRRSRSHQYGDPETHGDKAQKIQAKVRIIVAIEIVDKESGGLQQRKER